MTSASGQVQAKESTDDLQGIRPVRQSVGGMHYIQPRSGGPPAASARDISSWSHLAGVAILKLA